MQFSCRIIRNSTNTQHTFHRSVFTCPGVNGEHFIHQRIGTMTTFVWIQWAKETVNDDEQKKKKKKQQQQNSMQKKTEHNINLLLHFMTQYAIELRHFRFELRNSKKTVITYTESSMQTKIILLIVIKRDNGWIWVNWNCSSLLFFFCCFAGRISSICLEN